jgi:ribosome biogenesis GTPase / thiamine phosphate phosphatase
MADKKKIRVELRKNRTKPPRTKDWTRGFQEHGFADEAPRSDERVRAKGDLSRRRTIVQTDDGAAGDESSNMPSVDPAVSKPGRVMQVHGLHSLVATEDGTIYRCAVRRLLKSLATDERSVVATGDNVWLRVSPVSSRPGDIPEGLIERVEPRHGVLTRDSRGREHVLVANVDQLVIVMSLVEPDLKPHLIDRYLAGAQQGGLAPILCLNKVDLVSPEPLQALIGAYSQLGIPTILTSATTGAGVAALRERLVSRTTVFAGQSGVGKSSLLNAIQPGLDLRVREVSDVNQKGKHTTTTALLLKLDFGGWVVDTPGIRQLKLWRIRPEEVEGLFSEFRPFVAHCSFPDCTHTHEDGCAIQRALHRKLIAARRFTSYLGLYAGEDPS